MAHFAALIHVTAGNRQGRWAPVEDEDQHTKRLYFRDSPPKLKTLLAGIHFFVGVSCKISTAGIAKDICCRMSPVPMKELATVWGEDIPQQQ